MILKIKNYLRKVISGPFLFYLAHPWAFRQGIVAGPFKGTYMTTKTTWCNLVYLFVGSYEKELHQIWNELNSAQCRTAFVIGAAEGYYACGFAKKWGTKVTAFETSNDSRRVLTKNIRLNGLQKQIQVCGRCENIDFLNRIKREAPSLLICDIEGGENEVFSDQAWPLLSQTILVIEMHPPYNLRSKAETLAKTHNVQIISPVERSTGDYPFRDWISDKIKLRWLNEDRPFQTPWLVAFPQK